MLGDFVMRATVAGVGVAIAAAPLGCFVIWRRMAYFGDATAHAAILGVAIALALSISITAGVFAVALMVALVITQLSGRSMPVDTLLGVIAHASLAIGLVAVSLLGGPRVDLSAFLFGDILTVTRGDLVLIWGGGLLVAGVIAARWSRLLTSTLSPDLARASDIDPKREQLVLTVCLALIVAAAIKIIGALLISSLLIIPAAAARPLAKTPEAMAIWATFIAAVVVVAGIQGSVYFDTQTGPTIVCIAAFVFAVTHIFGAARSHKSY